MKKIILAAVGTTALIASLSVLAGPDWYVIEKARAAKQTEMHAAQMQQKTGDPAAMMKTCREMMTQPMLMQPK
ncbi:hypothetical protein [Cupriavidus sp. 8B]